MLAPRHVGDVNHPALLDVEAPLSRAITAIWNTVDYIIARPLKGLF